MHPLVELAKRTVEEYVKKGRVPDLPDPLPAEMTEKAGVFVSIKKHGELRGCIGTFMPTRENIAEEIVHNAVAASTQDPRFSPVKEKELSSLTFSVDLLSAPEPVKSMADLDPREYGVIVVCGYRKGLLLPDLEGVDTINEQLRIARMKAGIMPDEEVDIFRFRVRRFR